VVQRDVIFVSWKVKGEDAVFFAFVSWDISGDAVGWKRAFWVPCLTLSLAIVLWFVILRGVSSYYERRGAGREEGETRQVGLSREAERSASREGEAIQSALHQQI
jgi:chloramphenicol 3-O-phosphotransferase